MTIDDAQRENLKKLATYLESLPRDYEHFDMGDYLNHSGGCDVDPRSLLSKWHDREYVINCGTVACAVGHGPAAGVPMTHEERLHLPSYYYTWNDYCERAFGVTPSSRLFDFLFGGAWVFCDNTHRGAAARIRYFLDTGKCVTGYHKAMELYEPYLVKE